MIDHEPMTVCSRGRLYTTADQRRRLDIEGRGHGRRVAVAILTVDRGGQWGVATSGARFGATLGSDGELTIPHEARTHLDIEAGDDVRVSLGTAPQ